MEDGTISQREKVKHETLFLMSKAIGLYDFLFCTFLQRKGGAAPCKRPEVKKPSGEQAKHLQEPPQVQLHAEVEPGIPLWCLSALSNGLFILAGTLCEVFHQLYNPDSAITLIQVLTGTHHTAFGRCSRAPPCCSPDPFYTPHRCSRPSSWPSFLWCRHTLHDTSWYTSHSQCKTFTEKQDMNV